MATTTCFVLVRGFFLLALIAVIFLPLRCSVTVALMLTSAHAGRPPGRRSPP